ncbi:MAG: HAD family phosphatase [Treponema sp.]|nr:HAD family phosphatase [Treponema sp.]
MEKIKAIVFDMDGILLDTETICDRTWAMAARTMGIQTDVDFVNECRGTNFHDTCIILKRCLGQDFDVDRFMQLNSQYFHEIEFGEGIPLMPYAKEILEYLKPRYRIALASSTRGESVRRQLTNAGLIDYFETLTTGDMVSHSKPDPEIYRLACNSIGLEPENCIAVEDSPNGIRSASAAGLNVIMVPDKIKPDEKIKALCCHVFDSLKGLESVL